MPIGVGAGLAIAAAATAGGAATGAAIQSHGANKAADKQTAAANYAADVQSKSAGEAMAFARQQAENEARNAEATRHANYDQWAAREQRLGSVGQALGYGGRAIPSYVPTTDQQFNAPPQAPPQAVQRDPRLRSVGAYLTPQVTPGVTLPDPYTLRPVGAYL